MSFRLDHLAIAAPSLEAGVAYVRELLGVEMWPGGRHPLMGTHNRLLRLGDDAYLEVIAVDPAAPAPSQFKRWFALDDVEALAARWQAGKRLAAWVAAVDDLDLAIAGRFDLFGHPTALSRGDLSWRFGVRGDGKIPGDGALPYLIEWPEGKGPASRLPASGFKLVRLDVTSPDDVTFARAPDNVAHRKGTDSCLEALIETPQGPVVLR